MAESKKDTPSLGQSKKKNSLLDLDFGEDDFLSSWKSMSVTEDGTMDLDFVPISKGKKTAFSFDKADLDFNLEGDFGKMPSFNLDIPDIDISSPVKKDGKSKERSKEEATRGNNRGKADGFDFTFDFPDLDGFNFKSKSKKEDPIAKGGEDKENSSNIMLSRDCLVEDIDEHQHESRNLPVSGSVKTSNLDLQGCASCSPESSNTKSPESAKMDGDHLNSAAAKDGASDKEMTLVKKKVSSRNQELDISIDNSNSPELLSQEVSIVNENSRDKSVRSVFRNESCPETVPDVQDEVSFGNTKVSNVEQSAKEKLITDSGSSCEIPVRSDSSFNNSSITDEKMQGSQIQTDNVGYLATKEAAEPVQSRIQDAKFLPANVSTELLPGTQVHVKNQDIPELTSSLNRRTANTLMRKNENEAVTRSKYFTPAEKTESRFQNASNWSTCSPISDKLIGAKQLGSLYGSGKCNSKENKSEIKLADTSSSHSRAAVKKEPSQFGSSKSFNEFKKKSSPINTSSLCKPTNKSSSKNTANPTSLTLSMVHTETFQNKSAGGGDKLSSVKGAGGGDKLSSVKAIKQMPTLSSPSASRIYGTKLDSSKSSPHRDTMVSRDEQQDKILARVAPSKTLEEVQPKMQTPSAPSLKRKFNEPCGSDLILKPLKRLSESPSTRNSAEIAGKILDSKACENEKAADIWSKSACKNQNNSNLDVPLEVPSSPDYDCHIEMGEACRKGLEDICNLLIKKHDEAKEILARAVVTNNRLLMLTHPMYEEKIRIVEKFAMQLTLKEIQTPT